MEKPSTEPTRLDRTRVAIQLLPAEVPGTVSCYREVYEERWSDNTLRIAYGAPVYPARNGTVAMFHMAALAVKELASWFTRAQPTRFAAHTRTDVNPDRVSKK